MSVLLGQVENNIRAQGLLQPNQFLFVGVSGGLDSMVLLHVLHQLAEEHGWMPVVLHFNHQLRGDDSDADENLVRDVTASLGLKCITERGNVQQYARQHKLSIEMAARELRHGFFARTSSGLGIDTLALAHHADDQVELFFLRLFRGTSGEGLAGMSWASPSPKRSRLRLVRPFLNVTKRQLHAFADRETIAFREDATNAQLDQDRNRIRNELLGLLKEKYQPGIIRTTLRLMEIVGAESEFVQQTARMWKQRKVDVSFDQLHVAVQRQVLYRDLLEMGVTPDFELIERLRRSANEVVMVNPQLTVWRDKHGHLRSRAVSSVAFRGESTLLDLSRGDGQTKFAGVKVGWKIAPFGGLKEYRPSGKSRSLEYFDADKVGTAVCLRHWRPGDRIQPIGMQRGVKVQDLFTNRKIAREKRRELLVATTTQDEVFWVEGLRISERFKLTDETTSVLAWRWSRAR